MNTVRQNFLTIYLVVFLVVPYLQKTILNYLFNFINVFV